MLRSMQKRIAMGEEGVGRVRLGGLWANGGSTAMYGPRVPSGAGSWPDRVCGLHRNRGRERGGLNILSTYVRDRATRNVPACTFRPYVCRWSRSAGPCRERGCPLMALLGDG